MYKDKYKVKYLSRKVVLAWKKAADSQTISWQEVFPIICALYELDDNFQKDESFQSLNIENQLFYSQFQEILNELNVTCHNIHYFRKLTKHLLKTYLDVNKELHKLQDQAKNSDTASTISSRRPSNPETSSLASISSRRPSNPETVSIKSISSRRPSNSSKESLGKGKKMI